MNKSILIFGPMGMKTNRVVIALGYDKMSLLDEGLSGIYTDEIPEHVKFALAAVDKQHFSVAFLSNHPYVADCFDVEDIYLIDRDGDFAWLGAYPEIDKEFKYFNPGELIGNEGNRKMIKTIRKWAHELWGYGEVG